jgi:hypothetical protein
MNLVFTSPRTGSTVTQKLLKLAGTTYDKHHYCLIDETTGKVKWVTGRSDIEDQKTDLNFPSEVNSLIYIRRNVIDQVCSEIFHERFANRPQDWTNSVFVAEVRGFLNSTEFLIRTHDNILLNFTRTWLPFLKWPAKDTKRYMLSYDTLLHEPKTYASHIAQILSIEEHEKDAYIKKATELIESNLLLYPDGLAKSKIVLTDFLSEWTKKAIYNFVCSWLEPEMVCFSQVDLNSITDQTSGRKDNNLHLLGE